MVVARQSIATAEELIGPDIAWPTVLLWAGALAVFASVPLFTWADPSPWLIPISFVAAFALFTPMHESCHSNLARKPRILNHLIGRTCGWAFLAPYPAFVYVHLEHHKHTNDQEKDPDCWSGRGPVLLLPLRWMSQELHYYVPVFKAIARGDLSALTAVEVLLTLVGAYGCIFKLWSLGYGVQMLYFWIVPSRMAITSLAFCFDYVPHRPHNYSREEDIYQSTAVIQGIVRWMGELDLTVPLLGQNLHNIHHLYPTVPWYRYKAVWEAHKEQFIAAGTPLAYIYDGRTDWVDYPRTKDVYAKKKE